MRITAAGDGLSRLDVLLSKSGELTRSRAAALVKQGCVTVDGSVSEKSALVPAPGAEVAAQVPEPAPAAAQAQDIPLEIYYQDEDLAVVFKPAGMVVHPAAGNEDQTLVNALLYHLDHLSGIGGERRPGIVHRLDKDTSGLLLVAKNDAAHAALSKALADHEMEKHYRALVEGVIREDAGEINAPLARSKKDRKKMAVDPEGRAALTQWRVLARSNRATLLDVHLITGRTHQIRVHMTSIGHPVAGDAIYGMKKGVPVPRLMLHAYTLAFTHPTTGQRMTFCAPLPGAFLKGLKAAGVGEWTEGSELCSPGDAVPMMLSQP